MSAMAFIRLSLFQNKMAINPETLGINLPFTPGEAPLLTHNRLSSLFYRAEKKGSLFSFIQRRCQRFLEREFLGGVPEWTYMVLIIFILFWIEYLSLVSLLGVVE
ncbi:MAG: hypothetical protein K2X66_08855 [Cyanobacteria bacterium]|nr:hypothetical protein [Cyanobacteriota bacterium]